MRNKDTNRAEFTLGQMALGEMIEEMGFPVDMEEHFAPYTVDLYLRNAHVGIEYDGSGHWKKKDQKRDAYLMEHYSLPILRLSEIIPEFVIQKKMLNFIWEWSSSANSRKECMWNVE